MGSSDPSDPPLDPLLVTQDLVSCEIS